MGGEEVLVTGVGVVSPFGVGYGAFCRGLAEGRCAVRAPRPEGPPLWQALAGEFDAGAYVHNRALKYVGPATQMLCVAVKVALADACLATEKHEVAMVIGTAMGNLPQTAAYTRRIMEGAPAQLSPMLGFDAAQNSAVSFASAVCGIRGCVRTVAAGWIASGRALQIAIGMIRLGLARIVVAGGVEQASPLLAELYRAQGVALAQGCPRPFDRCRQGVSFGEGSFVMVLETAQTMRERKARAYGQIAAVCSSAGCAGGEAVENRARAMRGALAAAHRAPQEIDAISAAANSSLQEDRAEGEAIGRVFGEAVAVTAIKSIIGETCGAAAAAQVIQSLASIRSGKLPPVCCLREIDPAIGLKGVARRTEPGRYRAILVNSADPAGGVCSVVVAERGEA